jgi:GNAT superfamily N-acetyltransferase
MDITARLARLDDLDFVAQDGYIPLDTVRRKIEDEEVFVAVRDTAPVGYARIEYMWSLVPFLSLILVQPSHRRQGAGKALLHAIEEFLRPRGHDALYSSSTIDEPEPQAWHRHVGFEECGIITGINREGVGEIFFRKRLS